MPKGVARLTYADLVKYPHLAEKLKVYEMPADTPGSRPVPVRPEAGVKRKRAARIVKASPPKSDWRDTSSTAALVVGAWMLSIVFVVIVMGMV